MGIHLLTCLSVVHSTNCIESNCWTTIWLGFEHRKLNCYILHMSPCNLAPCDIIDSQKYDISTSKVFLFILRLEWKWKQNCFMQKIYFSVVLVQCNSCAHFNNWLFDITNMQVLNQAYLQRKSMIFRRNKYDFRFIIFSHSHQIQAMWGFCV